MIVKQIIGEELLTLPEVRDILKQIKEEREHEDNELGYVYLPAVLSVSLVSFFTAPLGVSIAYTLPVAVLRKIFGVLVFTVSVKMFLSVI